MADTDNKQPTKESVSDPKSTDYNPSSPLYDMTLDPQSKYYIGPVRPDDLRSGDELRNQATNWVDNLFNGWLFPKVDEKTHDKLVQSMYQANLENAKKNLGDGLEMRDPGAAPHSDWKNATHEQMVQAITTNADPAAVGESSEEWVSIGNELATHQQNLGDAINASAADWKGSGGDAARVHMANVAKWLGSTAQGATLTGRQQEIHSQALNETQKAMQANPPVQFSAQEANAKLMTIKDPVQYVQAYSADMKTYNEQQAAREQAAQIMTQYDQTVGGAVATPRFAEPPALPAETARLQPALMGSPAGGGAGAPGGVGPDGQPLGPDGQPLGGGNIPGQRIGPNGQLIGPDGQPLGSGGGSGSGGPGGSTHGSGAKIPEIGGSGGSGGSGSFGGPGGSIPGGHSGDPGSTRTSGWTPPTLPPIPSGPTGTGPNMPNLPPIPGGGGPNSPGFTPPPFTPPTIGPDGNPSTYKPTPFKMPPIPSGPNGIKGNPYEPSPFNPPKIGPDGKPLNITGPGGEKISGSNLGKIGGVNGESISSRLGGGGSGGLGGRGMGSGGPGSMSGAAGSGAAAEEAAAARAAGAAGAGGKGAPGSPGMGAMGGAKGGKGQEDKEHKIASYVESDDPSFFAPDEVVAPPVIGDWKNKDWK
ncbi:WXG100 family type VII secretion target [Amycolatopsis benzoatilytica]|uniref:WXG100 family type VII secretion target n=1 Tax=Amycolatopsis benzoatilytica TaxID=346045 RepID=UPI00035DF95D|nr:hypothetical protein [Amycolatopsis benzoatilytica]